jgi:hypothetical protein
MPQAADGDLELLGPVDARAEADALDHADVAAGRGLDEKAVAPGQPVVDTGRLHVGPNDDPGRGARRVLRPARLETILIVDDRLQATLELRDPLSTRAQLFPEPGESEPLLGESLGQSLQKLLGVTRRLESQQLRKRPRPPAVRMGTAEPVGLRSRVSGAVPASRGHVAQLSPRARLADLFPKSYATGAAKRQHG